ncbi:hypothetical protein [Streptomyces sp. ME18-1-4]|uniref:hypothetical protein n=1 Tax=Streptomyces sp. ME18-1-4 TaxID=3028685 RepID=UPI0029B2BE3E|nr:hypothetical protein [Streptomyces sp. ME18-1-4]MDX3240318.1 hypothetical protein [Streptomyces sp. ME18-1-4]
MTFDAQGASGWRSVYAMRDRGLVTVTRGGDAVEVRVTPAGHFYLQHGHHPDRPASALEAAVGAASGPGEPETAGPDGEGTRPAARRRSRVPYSERPVARARRAKATDLVERLVAEGSVVVRDPDEAEAAEWGRAVNYAKRHGLEPPGKRIEKRSYGRRGLELYLATGPHPNSREQEPDETPRVTVPAQLRAAHPVVLALRDDEGRLAMPSVLRRRALLLLQGLAAEAVRRGHEIRDRPGCSWRVGEVDVVIGGYACAVTIQQEFPQSTDPERSRKLVIELGYPRSARQSRWGDRKRWVLEDVLGAVFKEIEARAVEDGLRRQAEALAKAEREVRWRAAMEEAKERAAQAQFAGILLEEVGRWQEATALRAYCDALEHRIAEETDADELQLVSARQWLAWARRYARSVDPLHRLPDMPAPKDPGPEELKPFLKGWSPYGADEKRYGWGDRR